MVINLQYMDIYGEKNLRYSPILQEIVENKKERILLPKYSSKQ